MDHMSFYYILSKKDLNLRQCRWIELLNDYDLSILYYLDECNGGSCELESGEHGESGLPFCFAKDLWPRTSST
ncbi:hypothetical protein MTR67_011718 [Solanum verrucosum]|uniref:Uncharacterized protein n=1 Tax=Solanum verrucosum TaxID=315347 RepID=A0AAF0Q8Z7_SOLVR|nr:hypothetical protein MTR67_011718 [Solanum verrucosum]